MYIFLLLTKLCNLQWVSINSKYILILSRRDNFLTVLVESSLLCDFSSLAFYYIYYIKNNKIY